MPELPEVERFRQILLPLVHHTKNGTSSKAKTKSQKKKTKGAANAIQFELVGPLDKLPRKWVSPQDVDDMNANGTYYCKDVVRKGKQLCMVLEDSSSNKIKHFFLHMGMTGRLISPEMVCTWGQKYVSNNDDIGQDWPPRFTYLVMKSGTTKVAFADPRKFGGCYFADPDGNDTDNIYKLSSSVFDGLAPDGWLETLTPHQCRDMALGIANQRLGIKALILDQKRVVSGVGNWVADEVLYQCEIHPDQSYLTDQQALNVVETLHQILKVAVECLEKDEPYPDTWLFGYRWTKKQAGKDCKGRNLSFLTSGGRTSAIVASIQKLKKSQGKTTKAKGDNGKNVKVEKAKPKKTTKNKVAKPEKVPSSKKAKSDDDNKSVVKVETTKSKKKTTKRRVAKPEKVPSSKRVKVETKEPEDGKRRSGRIRNTCVRYVA